MARGCAMEISNETLKIKRVGFPIHFGVKMSQHPNAEHPGSAEQRDKERGQLLKLLWFYWSGIVLATVGELIFLFGSSAGAQGVTGGLSNTTMVVGGFVAVMWLGVALVFWTRFGGNGVPTALFCWMLAKGSAVLSMVTFFLDPNWQFSFVILGGFLVIMGYLQPPVFLPETPQQS